ncbi:centromere protein I [Gastrophryne carolinensis]
MQTPGSKLRPRVRRSDQSNVLLDNALTYFKNVSGKIQMRGNPGLLQHLAAVEVAGQSTGLPTDAVIVLLRLALSGHLAEAGNVRILKCLVPASDIPEETLMAAVSLFTSGRSSSRTQVFFLQWLISVFDLIPSKESLSCLYNFFFCLLPDDRLCPSLCHLLYLLTKREHVRAYRVRSLLELQSRKGLQPHILGLLSIYKVFCPELVSLSLPSRVKNYFKNSKPLFDLKKVVARKNGDPLNGSLLAPPKELPHRAYKRKWNSNPHVPVRSATLLNDDLSEVSDYFSKAKTFPVEKLETFSQLLENILRLELPAQMACVLKCPLLLHYINCTKEDDSLLRLNYWLAFTLQEECAWYNGKKLCQEEVASFLDTIIATQEFLQEGLSGTEDFLYKCLQHWNGCHRPQILGLISWIPLYSFPEFEGPLCETLAQLFIPSNLSFKTDLLRCLTRLLRNWAVQHSCCMEDVETMNDTMSGLMTSVENVIHFTGKLCTVGLQMHNAPLLLHVILDFYTLVSDLYVCYSLPVIVLPPPGVFYPALLCTDCVNLNHLCYVMYRYRDNLLIARRREEQQKAAKVPLNIHSQTFKLYNQYLTAMVGCLWTAQPFSLDTHPQGIRIEPEVLEKSGVRAIKNTFSIVFHPALMTFSAFFLKATGSEEKMFHLHLLKGQRWDDYTKFLCSEGMTDLDQFLKSSVNRVGTKNKDQNSTKQ